MKKENETEKSSRILLEGLAEQTRDRSLQEFHEEESYEVVRCVFLIQWLFVFYNKLRVNLHVLIVLFY